MIIIKLAYFLQLVVISDSGVTSPCRISSRGGNFAWFFCCPLLYQFPPSFCANQRSLSLTIIHHSKGNDSVAYRDPTAILHNNCWHLFFTLVEIEVDGKIFAYIAMPLGSDMKNRYSK
ncbi:MAG: hypothetical protein EOO04_37365 [Chitinophagaceae bacterium]|nr:MAG: hypothetical protein EOO04_37365 [Chitinophagaceae bacterium]